jgi:hypothetical protein
MVKWGDGHTSTVDERDGLDQTHTYSSPGTYDVEISPKLARRKP